jgi:hypothetical protein
MIPLAQDTLSASWPEGPERLLQRRRVGLRGAGQRCGAARC